MTTQVVQSSGIYHGLPVYSADTPSQVAIVTGANGIVSKSDLTQRGILTSPPSRGVSTFVVSEHNQTKNLVPYRTSLCHNMLCCPFEF